MKETRQKAKDKLVYHSEYGEDVAVRLQVQSYLNNGRIYIGLNCDGNDEPYADLTVNIDAPAPLYCGYLDTNNLSKSQDFVLENDLGEFTGFMGRSGYCKYPLYFFNVEKLCELCPDEMAVYEQSIGNSGREPEKEKSR